MKAHAAQLRRAHGRHEKPGRAPDRLDQQGSAPPSSPRYRPRCKSSRATPPRTLTNSAGQTPISQPFAQRLKARPGKVSEQLGDVQSSQQSLAVGAGPANKRSNRLPLRLGLGLFSTSKRRARDYNGEIRTTSPRSSFSDYIRLLSPIPISPETAISIWVKFNSVRETISRRRRGYDQVLQNFPTGTKAASAQLKKGFSLIELGKQEDGVVELRHVMQHYAKSNEALQAGDTLRKLGVATQQEDEIGDQPLIV